VLASFFCCLLLGHFFGFVFVPLLISIFVSHLDVIGG